MATKLKELEKTAGREALKDKAPDRAEISPELIKRRAEAVLLLSPELLMYFNRERTSGPAFV
jgi:hypothetical protein